MMPVPSCSSHSIVLSIENKLQEEYLKSCLSALGFELQLSYRTNVGEQTEKYEMTNRNRQRNGLAHQEQAWARRAGVSSYLITPI